MASTIAWDLVARDKASDKFKKVGDSADDVDGKFSKLGRGAAKLGKALAVGLAAGAAAAIVVGKKLIEAGERASTSNARIEQVATSMGLFGDQADHVSGRLVKLAEATARNTGVDQNSIKMTQAKLLTFKEIGKSAGEVGGHFDRATQAAVDLAATGFGTAETNAVQLGKALNDPIKGITALARAGVTFTEQEKEKIAALVESGRMSQAQEMILKSLETQVGGVAAATANSTDKMKVAWSQVQERLGEKLMPVLGKVTDVIIGQVMPAVEKFASKAEPYVKKFTDFVANDLWPIIQKVTTFFRDHVAPVIGKIVTGAVEGARGAFDSVREAIKRNEPEIRDIVTAFGKVASFVGSVLGPTLKLTFQIIGGVIGTVIDVVALLWRGWQKVDQIVIPIIKGLATTFLNVVGVIIDGAAKALGWVPGLGGKLKGAADKFRDFRDDVNSALRGVDDKVSVRTQITGGQEAINKIADLRWQIDHIPRAVTVNVLNKVKNIPMNASGTKYFEGGLTWVGERGPELVSLPRGTEIFSNQDSVAMTHGAGGPASSATESVATVQLVLDGRVIQQSLLRLKRANGRTDLELA